MHIRPYQDKDKDSIIRLSNRFSQIQFMEYRNQQDMEQ